MSKDDKFRVHRGGSWGYDPARARVAFRVRYEPSRRYFNLGFRLARTVSPLERLSGAGEEVSREQG